MEIITMKLVDLVKPEKNVRIHTEQQLKEFQRSVKMFGQIRPIVVDENNVILAGNGLYETLIAMGKETADVYKYDNLTENQKKKLMIADNKDCKAIYEGLISGDPKLRSYRALYQRIYGKYITEAKKKEGMTNG